MLEGHEVTVLTGLPNYPAGKVDRKYKWFKNREEINGVRVIRSWLIGRGQGNLRLAVNYVTLKKFFKKPLIIYCHDLWPDSIVSGGISENSIIYRALYAIQDTKTAMINGSIAVGLNIILALVLVRYLGLGGLALGTSISELSVRSFDV